MLAANRPALSAASFAAIAVIVSLAGMKPAHAQGAGLTDEDVFASCSAELRGRNQWLADMVRSTMYGENGAIRWRDIHIKLGNTGQAAAFQRTIDKDQVELAELEAGDPQSTFGWLHWSGEAMLPSFNRMSATQLRGAIAGDEKDIREGSTNKETVLRLCVLNLRLAQFEAKPAAGGRRPMPQSAGKAPPAKP